MLQPPELSARYEKVTSTLKRLLKVDFTNSFLKRRGPLAASVRSVIELNQKGLINLSELELIKLDILATNLDKVAQHDSKLMKLFAKKLRADRIDDYIGALCEVNTACVLIANNTRFEKMESPSDAADFAVDFSGRRISIECSSVHLSDAAENKDLKYKIESTIRKKAQKPYCNARTALSIEITNIQYHSQTTTSRFDPALLKSHFDRVVRSYGFGSLLLFSYVADLDQPVSRLSWCWIRIDHDDTASELVAFLDKHFPFGDYRIKHSAYPYAG